MHTDTGVEPTLLDQRKALANTSVKANAARANNLFTLENTFIAPPKLGFVATFMAPEKYDKHPILGGAPKTSQVFLSSQSWLPMLVSSLTSTRFQGIWEVSTSPFLSVKVQLPESFRRVKARVKSVTTFECF